MATSEEIQVLEKLTQVSDLLDTRLTEFRAIVNGKLRTNSEVLNRYTKADEVITLANGSKLQTLDNVQSQTRLKLNSMVESLGISSLVGCTVSSDAILTTAGTNKINSATPAAPLTIKEMYVGDGNGVIVIPTVGQTALKRKVWGSPLSNPIFDGNNDRALIFEAVIPASDGGFTVREAALVDDTGAFIAVASTVEVVKPSNSAQGGKTLSVRIRIILDNASDRLKFKNAGVAGWAGATSERFHSEFSELDAADAHPPSSVFGLNEMVDEVTGGADVSLAKVTDTLAGERAVRLTEGFFSVVPPRNGEITGLPADRKTINIGSEISKLYHMSVMSTAPWCVAASSEQYTFEIGMPTHVIHEDGFTTFVTVFSRLASAASAAVLKAIVTKLADGTYAVATVAKNGPDLTLSITATGELLVEDRREGRKLCTVFGEKDVPDYYLYAGSLPPEPDPDPEQGIILEKDEIKLIAFGDSFTDNGDGVPRNAAGSYTISTRGYWVCAWLQSTQNFMMLDAKGLTGNTTTQMLARITDVTNSEADVVLLLGGTNDLNQGATPEATRDGMAAILDAIIASGKKVLLTPIARRKEADFLNDEVDATNAYYAELVAARKDHVVMAERSPEFDDGCTASNPDVTPDGLHPSSYGAWLIGKKTAIALDKHFKSNPVARTNLAPNPDFAGDTGSALSGATGKAPTSWRIYYADPTNNGGTGVGGVVNPDGTFTVKTGSNTGISNGASAFVRTGNHNIPTQNAEYAFSIKVSAPKLTAAALFRLYIQAQDVSVGIPEFQVSIPAGQLAFDGITLRTPYINVKASTYLVLGVRVDSNGSEPIEFTLSEPNLYIK